MAPGWPLATGSRPGASSSSRSQRGLDQGDLRAVAGEVAVAERVLGEREVDVGVVDEAGEVGRAAARPGRSTGRGVGLAPGLGRRGRRRARRRARRPRASAATSRPMRVAEGRAPHDAVRRRDDDPPELGERRARRLQVDRLQVDERVAQRHDDEVAADDRAARLVPQRDLLADDRVLVDARLDLGGPEDRRLGREAVDPGVAVRRRRRCGRRPRRSCSAA